MCTVKTGHHGIPKWPSCGLIYCRRLLAGTKDRLKIILEQLFSLFIMNGLNNPY